LVQVKLAQAVVKILKKVFFESPQSSSGNTKHLFAVRTGLHTKCQQHESPQLTKNRPGTWPGLWCVFSFGYSTKLLCDGASVLLRLVGGIVSGLGASTLPRKTGC
jgi:hypothetical protein